MQILGWHSPHGQLFSHSKALGGCRTHNTTLSHLQSRMRSSLATASCLLFKKIVVKYTILVFSGCYHKNNIVWMAYQQQKFISHGSGRWEVYAQGAGGFDVWRRAASGFTGCVPSCHSLAWPKGGGSSPAVFHKGANPMCEGSVFMTEPPPKDPSSKYHHIRHEVSR